MFIKFAAALFLLSLVSVAFSAIGRSRPSVHPDHPGKCYHNETKQAYAPGESFTGPFCVENRCLSDFSFQFATCGAIGAPPQCYVDGGNLSLPYPDCCPNVQCPQQ